MRRLTLWSLSTVSALAMLFSYHTSTAPGESEAAEGPPTTPEGDAAPAPTPSTSTSSSSPSSSSSSLDANGVSTVLGDAVVMKFGAVQVQVILAGGQVTGVHAITYPMSNRVDRKINSSAIPRLDASATARRSSTIDMVSGATYTSSAYARSLQSALDKAHLG